MKAIFVYDVSINLWEQTKKSGDSSLATISVIERDIDGLSNTWYNLLPILLTFFPNVFRWFTTGNAFEGSKVQEFKLKKRLTEGFSERDVLKMNESTGIYSLVQDETSKIRQLSLSGITHYRYSSLVFCAKNPSPQAVLHCFQNADGGIVSENICSVFDNDLEPVLFRVYDDGETHATMQFIGKVNQIDIIKSEISSAGYKQIDASQVANIISC